MIKVLLVDDQSIIRQGLKVLLALEPDLTVVGDAENGRIALDLIRQLCRTTEQPDVVLMDLRMPVMDGVAATQEIHHAFPEIKVLVLTTFDEDELVHQALKAGALGYLLKDTPSEELAQAIRAVDRGYTQFGPGILQKLVTRMPETAASPSTGDLPTGLAELTPREREVLKWIGAGASNREIANMLYITEGTVKNYVTSILSRLELRDRTQAAILATSLRDYWDEEK